MFTLLDLCVSSLRRGHANLLCIVPILTDDPRRESKHVHVHVHKHSAQGLRYCRVKALPNQPYMTHINTFYLIDDLWISNLLMDVGVSRTKLGCTVLSAVAG